MDPRLRERRIAVRRREGRRRFRVLIAALSVPALAGAGYGVSRSALADLDHVRVLGASETSARDIAAAGGLHRGRSLVSIDTARVVDGVERLPWVLEAQAQRQWPGTVEVVVEERRPEVAVPVDGGSRWALVDGTGRVLATRTDKPAGLPVIGGLGHPGAPGATLGRRATPALRTAVALPADVRARVGDIAAVTDGVELQLVPSGVLVRLGGADQLDKKLRALDTFLAATSLDDVAVVDLRVPDAPVLTRRDNVSKVQPPSEVDTS